MKGGYDMNLYILVEDGKSGHKIIDHWIPTLLPTLTRVPTINEMTNNQYVIFSGLGYPRILGQMQQLLEKMCLVKPLIRLMTLIKSIIY